MTTKPKLTTLEKWAATVTTNPPKMPTLYKWARQGMINPPPVKMGKEWQVYENAVWLGAPRRSLVDRL